MDLKYLNYLTNPEDVEYRPSKNIASLNVIFSRINAVLLCTVFPIIVVAGFIIGNYYKTDDEEEHVLIMGTGAIFVGLSLDSLFITYLLEYNKDKAFRQWDDMDHRVTLVMMIVAQSALVVSAWFQNYNSLHFYYAICAFYASVLIFIPSFILYQIRSKNIFELYKPFRPTAECRRKFNVYKNDHSNSPIKIAMAEAHMIILQNTTDADIDVSGLYIAKDTQNTILEIVQFKSQTILRAKSDLKIIPGSGENRSDAYYVPKLRTFQMIPPGVTYHTLFPESRKYCGKIYTWLITTTA